MLDRAPSTGRAGEVPPALPRRGPVASAAMTAQAPRDARGSAARIAADRAVLGARIRTLDPRRPWATAVAMREGASVWLRRCPWWAQALPFSST